MPSSSADKTEIDTIITAINAYATAMNTFTAGAAAAATTALGTALAAAQTARNTALKNEGQ